MDRIDLVMHRAAIIGGIFGLVLGVMIGRAVWTEPAAQPLHQYQETIDE